MSRIRVLLADGNPHVLQAVVRLMGDTQEIAVVGCTSSSREAAALVLRLRPDLVVVELAMAKGMGLKPADSSATELFSPPIILTSMGTGEEYRLAAQSLGVAGFLWKPQLGNQLVPLILSLLGR